MNDYLAAVVLGIIEGLTEFLPVSSTGHLLIAQHWLGKRSDLFTVAIQAGAILAVTLVYRTRLSYLAHSLDQRQTRDYVGKLAGAFAVTAVFGLAAKALGVTLPETVMPIAIALVAGGVAILLIERHVAGLAPRSEVGWTVAIAVGLAQVLAGVFPGTSRSAAAIFAAMLFGLTARPRAAEFAFLVGIPTMFAATAYELFKVLGTPAARTESWDQLAIAFVVAAVTGFLAVQWLLRYISGRSFVPFGWYRIVFGCVLIVAV